MYYSYKDMFILRLFPSFFTLYQQFSTLFCMRNSLIEIIIIRIKNKNKNNCNKKLVKKNPVSTIKKKKMCTYLAANTVARLFEVSNKGKT